MFPEEDITTATEKKMHPWQETSFPKRFLAQRQDSAQIKRDKFTDAPIKGAEGSRHIISASSGKGCLSSHPPILPSQAQGLYLSKRASIIHARRITRPPAVPDSLSFSSPTSGCKVFSSPLPFLLFSFCELVTLRAECPFLLPFIMSWRTIK